MKVISFASSRCMTDCTPGETLMRTCDKPSVVLLETWAGRQETLCREHAEALRGELTRVLGGPGGG